MGVHHVFSVGRALVSFEKKFTIMIVHRFLCCVFRCGARMAIATISCGLDVKKSVGVVGGHINFCLLDSLRVAQLSTESYPS